MEEKRFVVLITGSREIPSGTKRFIYDTLNRYIIERILVGNAKGVDTIAKIYALEKDIPFSVYTPEWDKYGKSAGILRNNFMVTKLLEYPNRIGIAFWNGKSRGTKQCIKFMQQKGVRVDIYGVNTCGCL